jgi:hypothetical protein
MKVQHEGFCPTIEEHESGPVRSDLSRADSGVSLPSIRMNGHV